jgi:hypothetical protein
MCGTRWVQEGSYQREVRPSAIGRILAGRARAADEVDVEPTLLRVGGE